jgi:hypothetical protein
MIVCSESFVINIRSAVHLNPNPNPNIKSAVQSISLWYSPILESVGRRGTNQLRLLEWYLDVLVKHTTEIPPPTALVEVRPRLP